MTHCEKILWLQLRKRQLLDAKFRRQFGIGNYVLDFYCPELKIGKHFQRWQTSVPRRFRRRTESKSILIVSSSWRRPARPGWNRQDRI
jgi:hypothetical protein